jgi:hypothetical protein
MRIGSAITLAVALAIGIGSEVGARPARPSLGLVDLDPLAVQGVRFKPRERVAVQVLAPVRAARTAIASGRGSFRIRFRFRVGRCERVSVQAFGSRGSRARLLPQRELGYCPPSR